ncbi:GIY-YIG nuclease family protein [Candidatus Peregrinibacteria bacterium]|nr:GIY-YIG nuclease family protein [Candidatus Peregrinibacteria bacterium]
MIQHDVTKQIYIGKTSDLKRRLSEHNNNRQTSTVRKNGKWILVYAEAYRAKDDATLRETRLKHHGSAKHELKKRIRKSLF